MSKIAVVLFNLGGPDRPEAVQPFLFNLFNDPAIIGAPKPIRWLLAKFISSRRAPVAREIYTHLGATLRCWPIHKPRRRLSRRRWGILGRSGCSLQCAIGTR